MLIFEFFLLFYFFFVYHSIYSREDVPTIEKLIRMSWRKLVFLFLFWSSRVDGGGREGGVGLSMASAFYEFFVPFLRFLRGMTRTRRRDSR